MTYAKIAFRNLSRQKKRTIFLAGAIAFGVIAVTLLDSMTGSFVSNISRNFSDLSGGHIYVNGREKTESGREISVIRDNGLIEEAIAEADIDYRFLTRRSAFIATLFFEGKSVRQNIVGADWVKDSYFIERIILRSGSFSNLRTSPKGLIVSEEIADLLGVDMGDKVTAKLRTATGQYNTGFFFIAGISADPGFIGSIASFANLAEVNTLLNIGPDEYMTLGIYFADIGMTDEYVEPFRISLSTRVPLFDKSRDGDSDRDMFEQMMADQAGEEEWAGVKYDVTTINEILSELKEIIRILEQASLIFFIVLLLIIMVGINNTFRIVMLERVREIGTMRAVGSQRREVGYLFLLEAVFIALIGMVIGYVLAGIIMGIVSSINLGMDSPIFIVLKNGRFTFSLNVLKIIRNTIIVVALTILAALIPATKAAKLEPAEALRTQQ